MKQLFVFTASGADARQHVEDTIRNPIDRETVDLHFPADELKHIGPDLDPDSLYAWGATPGPANRRNWEAMEAGDFVLTYQAGRYTFVSQVIAKTHNPDFAEDVWGIRLPQQDTWEFVYFLTKPIPIDIPVTELGDYLNTKHQGFNRTTDDKVGQVEKDYGSLDSFISQRVLNTQQTYLLIRSNESSACDDQEGQSYHYANTVPNSSKVETGALFLVDRRYPEGKKIIARGRIGKVVELEDDASNKRHFQAAFASYEKILPPRVVTDEVDTLISSVPNYNNQHSIRVLDQDIYDELSRPPSAWIFQGNPNYFDVRASLKAHESKETVWTISQYRNQISVGDRVYFWESGEQGGIVAYGEILSEVEELPPEESQTRFDFEGAPDAITGVHPRCRVRILRVLDPILYRSTIKFAPGLTDLQILRFANATNFSVRPEEAEIIEGLLARSSAPLSPEERFLAEMKTYVENGVVFQSPPQARPYRIEHVDDSGCTTLRLADDTDTDVRCTVSLLREKINLVKENGGRYSFGEDFDGTAAIRTTILQAPCFGLSPDKKEIVLLESEADSGGSG